MSWMSRFAPLLGGRSPIPVAELTKKTRLEDLADCPAGNDEVLPPGPNRSEADRIAESIRDFPEDWRWLLKGYELIHTPSGFVLWVANRDYGLAEIYSGGGKAEFSKPEQAIIWPAVEGWLARNKVGFTGRLPKVKITGRGGSFWCFSELHPWVGFGRSPAEAYRSWAMAVSVESRKGQCPDEILHVWSAAR